MNRGLKIKFKLNFIVRDDKLKLNYKYEGFRIKNKYMV